MHPLTDSTPFVMFRGLFGCFMDDFSSDITATAIATAATDDDDDNDTDDADDDDDDDDDAEKDLISDC
eukprot:CAMPEP_0171016424 /NCGR_PEP_ID=MMETSP0736-20130129/26709_1 /TAXON_ID=186038 /ORGANISM="Fragilariopsis kerguelensis, Strain L26-C5" /LENGTH=67 /DNA_ID=CAMNT_0011451827 /DNA_START=200 /DNA_END=404 /DNA_ORIENTATION=+